MNLITLVVQDSLGNELGSFEFTPLVDDKVVTNSYYGSTYIPVGPMSSVVIIRLPVSEEDEGKEAPTVEGGELVYEPSEPPDGQSGAFEQRPVAPSDKRYEELRQKSLEGAAEKKTAEREEAEKSDPVVEENPDAKSGTLKF